MAVREGELEFDFSKALSVEKLDKQERNVPSGQIPHGMSLVDFVVEERHRFLLIEVKDPSQAEVPTSNRGMFAENLLNDALIHKNLVPKARDSYAFLHLMERNIKPFLYVVLLGLEKVSIDQQLLPGFKDRLLRRVRHEADVPWKLHYVTDCVVATISNWANVFPDYPLARVGKS